MSKITSTGPSAPLQPIAEVESPQPKQSAPPQENSKANTGALDLLNSPSALGNGPVVRKITDKFGEFRTRTMDSETLKRHVRGALAKGLYSLCIATAGPIRSALRANEQGPSPDTSI